MIPLSFVTIKFSCTKDYIYIYIYIYIYGGILINSYIGDKWATNLKSRWGVELFE